MKSLHGLFCNKENELFLYVKKFNPKLRQEEVSTYEVRRSFVVCSANSYQASIKQIIVIKKLQAQYSNLTALFRLTKDFQQIAWFDFDITLPPVSTMGELGIRNRFGIRIFMTYRNECINNSQGPITENANEERPRWTAKDRNTRETAVITSAPKLISQTIKKFTTPENMKKTDVSIKLENLLKGNSTREKLFTTTRHAKLSSTKRSSVMSSDLTVSRRKIETVNSTLTTSLQNNITNTLLGVITDVSVTPTDKTVSIVSASPSTTALVIDHFTSSQNATQHLSTQETFTTAYSRMPTTRPATSLVETEYSEPLSFKASPTTTFPQTPEDVLSSDADSARITSSTVTTTSHTTPGIPKTTLLGTTVPLTSATALTKTHTSDLTIPTLTTTTEPESLTTPKMISLSTITSESTRAAGSTRKSFPTDSTVAIENITSKEETDNTDNESFWPVVVGLVIGLPAVIVFGIAITVIHRKRSTKIPRFTASDLRNARSAHTNISR